LDGGIGNGVYVTIYTVESETFQIPNPTKQENEFLGWTGTGLNEATKNLVIPKGSTGNRVYTATWGLNQYSITFVFDNGRPHQTTTADYGSTVILLGEPTKKDYTFGGWKVTSTDGEWTIGTVYAGSSTIPVLSGNVTLTAVWIPPVTTITFDTDGGTEIAPITQNYGTAVTAPADPTKTGYTFAGWDATIPSTIPAENITITAQWSPITYTVAYNANEGAGGMSSVIHTYDAAKSLTANTFTRTGYTFEGWNTKADGSGTAYADNTSVINLTATAGETVTLYAQWEIVQYTITFDTDGGTAVAPITQNYGTAVTAPAAPTKTGYTFAGWDATIPTTMPAENITIKAKWTINQYTITIAEERRTGEARRTEY
jgi:uncharacterized repeat protein (TIGR02543 family)